MINKSMLVLLAGALVTGCQSQPLSSVPPAESPKTSPIAPNPTILMPPMVMKTTVRLTSIKVSLSNANTVQFIYPSNASDYIWSEQMSTNLESWITLKNGLQGIPSGALEVTSLLPCAFYRMQGQLIKP